MLHGAEGCRGFECLDREKAQLLTKIEMTPEEALAHAKHQAEEKGQTVETAQVKDAPTVVYQIAGTGAVIK